MCDPITLSLMAAGTAASVAGGGIANREKIDNDTSIANARNAALGRTNATNLALSGKSRDLMTGDIGATTGAQGAQGLQNAQQSAVNTIQGNMAPTGAEPTLDGSMPKVAQSGLGKAISDAAAKSSARGQAMGNLLGYQTYGRDVANQDRDTTSGVGMNNNFVKGNEALLPSILDDEQIKANKPSSGLGGILSTIGGALGGVAGSRAGKQGFNASF